MSKMTKAEQEKLVLENMRLVPYVLKNLGLLSNPEVEDLIQLGNIGLIKAAKTFDKSKAKFLTYAAICIRNEVLMYLRKEKKKVNTVSLQDEFYRKDGSSTSRMTYEETIEDKKSVFINSMLDCETIEDALSLILNRMECRERIIMLYSMSKLTQEEIAKKIKISQTYVCRLQKKARLNLKLLLEEETKYEEKYAIKMIRETDNMMFIINNVEDLYLFSKKIMNKLKEENIINYFSLKCKDNKIAIQLPADSSSFRIIAEILQTFN